MIFFIILSVIVLILGVLSFYSYFLRDPERVIPEGDSILAPADGKVIEILTIDKNKISVDIDKGLFGRIRTMTEDMGGGTFTLISIFMNPMNVHVQRSPISGEILNIIHRDGRFKMAASLKAIENERTETLIKSAIGNVKVIQIAGIMVRRIENWLSEKKEVTRGERMGRILMGSQVTLLFPYTSNIQIKIKKGDKVTAGETVLAEFNNSQKKEQVR